MSQFLLELANAILNTLVKQVLSDSAKQAFKIINFLTKRTHTSQRQQLWAAFRFKAAI